MAPPAVRDLSSIRDICVSVEPHRGREREVVTALTQGAGLIAWGIPNVAVTGGCVGCCCCCRDTE